MNISPTNFRGNSYSTTTTTTFHQHTPACGHGANPFRNANKGLYNNPAGQVQFSSKAQMLMTMMSLMNQVMSGDFGGLMNSLNGMGGGRRPQQGFPMMNPGFGRRNRVGGPQSARNAAPVAPGQVKEMKAGQSARGANGTVVNWGKDGNVNMSYRDQNGQMKKIDVKNGMISFDGGPPQKLQNRGQMLQLPNGDVVGIGNAERPGGQKELARVVVSDNAQNIPTNPPGKTNIYNVDGVNRQYTTNEGAGVSMNVTQGSYRTPFGEHNYMSTSISAFSGIPVTRNFTEQILRLIGTK